MKLIFLFKISLESSEIKILLIKNKVVGKNVKTEQRYQCVYLCFWIKL